MNAPYSVEEFGECYRVIDSACDVLATCEPYWNREKQEYEKIGEARDRAKSICSAMNMVHYLKEILL